MVRRPGLRTQPLQETSTENAAEVWRRWHADRSIPARDTLVLHYAGLVRYVVAKLGAELPASVDFDDLVQAGVIGLMDAVDRFEPERGLKFETYAVQRIRGAVLDELRALDWVPRSVRAKARALAQAQRALETRLQGTPTAQDLAIELGWSPDQVDGLRRQLHHGRLAALDELLADSGDGERGALADSLADPLAPAIEDDLLQEDLQAALRRALESLPDRDRKILVLSYVEQLTLRQIGTALGVTESRVSQLRAKAVTALRDRLQASYAV